MFPSFFQVSFLKSGLTSFSKFQYLFLCRQKRLQITDRSTVSKTCSSPSVEFCWPQPYSRVIIFKSSVNIGHSSIYWQVNTQNFGQQWSNNKPAVLGQVSCYASKSWFVTFHDDKPEQTLVTTVCWNLGHHSNSHMGSFLSLRGELWAHSCALLSGELISCLFKALINTVFIKSFFFLIPRRSLSNIRFPPSPISSTQPLFEISISWEQWRKLKTFFFLFLPQRNCGIFFLGDVQSHLSTRCSRCSNGFHRLLPASAKLWFWELYSLKPVCVYASADLGT